MRIAVPVISVPSPTLGCIAHTAVCRTGDCAWRSGPHPVKAAAEEQARWHREQHRRGGASA
jgi:hypothetical protein